MNPREESIRDENGLHRRHLLRVCGVSAALGLAGCSSGDSNDDGDNGDDGGDNGNENGDENGEEMGESFQEAIDLLVQNADRLAELAGDGGEPAQEDVDELETQLSDAESALDEAEGSAGQNRIDAARETVDIQRELIGYQSLAVDWDDSFNTALAYYDNDEYDRTDAELENAMSIVEDIETQIETAQTTLEEADTSALDESSLQYDSEVWEYVGVDSWDEYDAIASFTRGYRQFAQMVGNTVEGENRYLSEEYQQAENLFGTALGAGQNALTQFESAENNPGTPEDLRPNVIELRGLAEDWLAAIERFEEAAVVAQTGDIEEAEAIYQEGVDLLPTD